MKPATALTDTPADLTPTLPFAAEPLTLPAGWSGCTVPQHFPARHERERRDLLSTLWDAAFRLFPAAQAEPAAWLLMDNLHRDNAVLRLSRNAREWKPTYSLGLWPDQPPPAMLTGDEILGMEWGARPRLPYHTVAWLHCQGNTLHDAWSTMFGTGSTVLTLCPGGGSALLAATRQVLKQPITDESFQNFPFYFPLLGHRSLQHATAARLDSWLGPTCLYLRESEEDEAVLLLARTTPQRLAEALHSASVPA